MTSFGHARESAGSGLLKGPRPEGVAYTTPAGEVLLLRHCRGLSEFQACVDLQKAVWGYEDSDATPRKGFVLASELGGQVIGAFDSEGTLVGFAMAMPAFESAAMLEAGPYAKTPKSAAVALPGPEAAAALGSNAAALPEPNAAAALGSNAAPALYLHSHMLAVLAPYRRSGLGTRLKLLQREDALARGITRMTWTFDPLAAKNASLNLHKLGAIARRYSPNFYGVFSSRLQGSLPSDRLHAEWRLLSERVVERAAALLGEVCAVSPERLQATDREYPGAAAGEIIFLPSEIERWRRDDLRSDHIQAVQSANRERFLEAFARGMAAVDFTLDAHGNGLFHLAPLSGLAPSPSIQL